MQKSVFLIFLIFILKKNIFPQSSYELNLGLDLPMYKSKFPSKYDEIKTLNRRNFHVNFNYNFLESKLFQLKAGIQYAYSDYDIDFSNTQYYSDGYYSVFDRQINDTYHQLQFNVAFMQKGILFKKICIKPIAGANFGLITYNHSIHYVDEYLSKYNTNQIEMYFDKGLYGDFYYEFFGGLRFESRISDKFTLTSNILCAQKFHYTENYVSKKNVRIDFGIKKDISNKIDTIRKRNYFSINYSKSISQTENNENYKTFEYDGYFNSYKMTYQKYRRIQNGISLKYFNEQKLILMSHELGISELQFDIIAQEKINRSPKMIDPSFISDFRINQYQFEAKIQELFYTNKIGIKLLNVPRFQIVPGVGFGFILNYSKNVSKDEASNYHHKEYYHYDANLPYSDITDTTSYGLASTEMNVLSGLYLIPNLNLDMFFKISKTFSVNFSFQYFAFKINELTFKNILETRRKNISFGLIYKI